MKQNFNRREFLAASTTLAASLGLQLGPGAGRAVAAASAAPQKFQTKLYKALINDQPKEDYLKKLKEAGFDGVEGGVISRQAAEKCRAMAEKEGLKIHAVLRGWAEFNSRDKAKADASFVKTEEAVQAAQGFGADAVLLVPCRIGGMKMPRPWEFHIEFDEKTGHISKVVVGDNAPYAEYIEAHNHSVDTSREYVKRLIPIAEKAQVVIALENVWNNLWVKPAIFANFVESFQNPWIKTYFDIGNHVKYAPPEDWILALGKTLAKCHVKDFKLNMSDPNGNGDFVNIRDGSVRWPVVRSALEAVGYNGWMTIEGGSCTMAEHSKRLDQIIAGV